MAVSWGHGNIADAPTTVDPLQPARIAISPSSAALNVGDSLSLTVTAYYSDGSSSDVTDLGRWSSADASIATIDSMGTVRGIDDGNTSMSFVYGSGLASCAVEVQGAPSPSTDDDWWWVL